MFGQCHRLLGILNGEVTQCYQPDRGVTRGECHLFDDRSSLRADRVGGVQQLEPNPSRDAPAGVGRRPV